MRDGFSVPGLVCLTGDFEVGKVLPVALSLEVQTKLLALVPIAQLLQIMKACMGKV